MFRTLLDPVRITKLDFDRGPPAIVCPDHGVRLQTVSVAIMIDVPTEHFRIYPQVPDRHRHEEPSHGLQIAYHVVRPEVQGGAPYRWVDEMPHGGTVHGGPAPETRDT